MPPLETPRPQRRAAALCRRLARLSAAADGLDDAADRGAAALAALADERRARRTGGGGGASPPPDAPGASMEARIRALEAARAALLAACDGGAGCRCDVGGREFFLDRRDAAALFGRASGCAVAPTVVADAVDAAVSTARARFCDVFALVSGCVDAPVAAQVAAARSYATRLRASGDVPFLAAVGGVSVDALRGHYFRALRCAADAGVAFAGTLAADDAAVGSDGGAVPEKASATARSPQARPPGHRRQPPVQTPALPPLPRDDRLVALPAVFGHDDDALHFFLPPARHTSGHRYVAESASELRAVLALRVRVLELKFALRCAATFARPGEGTQAARDADGGKLRHALAVSGDGRTRGRAWPVFAAPEVRREQREEGSRVPEDGEHGEPDYL